jgi:succinate dehydrogenase / fumarate reductase cytochrome b subunit
MRERAAGTHRPKNLDLTGIRLPLPGLVSILHRASGAFLFLALPWLLWLLERSLASRADFDALREVLAAPLVRLLLLGVLWAFLHHLCAGVRFLALDAHKGITLPTARRTSALVLAVSLALTALLGALWLC